MRRGGDTESGFLVRGKKGSLRFGSQEYEKVGNFEKKREKKKEERFYKREREKEGRD